MSDYTENFTSKTGDTVDASELETEFSNIATHMATKLDSDGSGTMTGALNMGSNLITNVTDPTTAQGAATKNYVDARHAVQSLVATTSGTTADFTGISANASHIVIAFNSVSMDNASSVMLVQIGDSGGLETSGYTGQITNLLQTSSSTASTNGWRVNNSNDPVNTFLGQVSLVKVADHTWIMTGLVSPNTSGSIGGWVSAGSKTLSGELDRVRVAVVGAGSYDAGSIGCVVHS